MKLINFTCLTYINVETCRLAPKKKEEIRVTFEIKKSHHFGKRFTYKNLSKKTNVTKMTTITEYKLSNIA